MRYLTGFECSRKHFHMLQMCIFLTSWHFHRKYRCLFVCAWSFGNSWRHLKQWTKTSPLSSSALSIYLSLKINYWPSLCDHVTFPNNGEVMRERWACGEFPHFLSKREALLSLNAVESTPALCLGVILPVPLCNFECLITTRQKQARYSAQSVGVKNETT